MRNRIIPYLCWWILFLLASLSSSFNISFFSLKLPIWFRRQEGRRIEFQFHNMVRFAKYLKLHVRPNVKLYHHHIHLFIFLLALNSGLWNNFFSAHSLHIECACDKNNRIHRTLFAKTVLFVLYENNDVDFWWRWNDNNGSATHKTWTES